MLKIYENAVEWRIQMDWVEADRLDGCMSKSGTISIGVWKETGEINVSATGSLTKEGREVLNHCMNIAEAFAAAKEIKLGY